MNADPNSACQVDSYQQQLDAKVAQARHVLEEAVLLGPEGHSTSASTPHAADARDSSVAA